MSETPSWFRGDGRKVADTPMKVDVGAGLDDLQQAPQLVRKHALTREARATAHELLQLIRSRPISAGIALVGWLALIAMSAVPDLICVGSLDGSNERLCWAGSSYWTLALLLGALLLMANEAAPDLVMLGFTVLLVASTVISDEEAWAGFSSTSVLSIGALFVVARALEETQTVERILMPLLGSPSNHNSAILRLCAPVALFSAFLNNTPIVAMLLPVCERWAAKSNLSLKVLLMPLSFGSMLGGMCTLIGTSTNLVLNAQIAADPDAPLAELTMFSMTAVALPAALVGMLYLAVVSPLIFRPAQLSPDVGPQPNDTAAVPAEVPSPNALRESGTGFGSRGSPRYTLEVSVGPLCELLIGEAPSQVGLLIDPSCTVRLLIRAGVLHPLGVGSAVQQPQLVMQDGDLLILACLSQAVEKMRKVNGLRLRPNTPSESNPRLSTSKLILVEAVVAGSSPLVNKKALKALEMPAFDGADVWAIRQRPGEQVSEQASWSEMPIHTPRSGMLLPPLPPLLDSDVSEEDWLNSPAERPAERPAELREAGQYWKSRRLRAGDTLLVEAPDSWVQAHRSSECFVVLNRVTRHAASTDSVVKALEEFRFAASIVALLLLLSLSSLDLVGLLPLAISLSFGLVGIGCINLGQAWRSISYRLVLTIACSFGPGAALTNTNVSAVIGAGLVQLQVLGDFGFLLSIYLITSALSCLVSNSATVVAFYSVLRKVEVEGITPEQLMITMMLGASSAFMTPIGYQTNLMVLGRGGYSFGDFLLLGGGLTVIVGCCVVAMCLLLI